MSDLAARSRLVLCLLHACTSAPATSSAPLVDATVLEPAPTNGITRECEGFPLRGLAHSPGGSVLPNRCAPFHPTLNNPYAVRCIDALPDFDSGYPGDEACILPPPPDKGIQLGIHPHGHSDDYWRAILAGDFGGYRATPPELVLSPGEESTRNYRETVRNAAGTAYYRIYFRLRSGGHHTIVTLHDTDEADGLIAGSDELPGFATDILSLVANLGGQQRMDENVPSTLDKPAEDQGLYLEWPERAQAMVNYHGFNPTEGALLRESWINVWWEEDRRMLARWFLGYELPQLLTLDIPPGETRDQHYVLTLHSDSRLISVLGHRHAWTSNFSAWVERADAQLELVYRSVHWSDIPTYRYDSLTQNPAPDAQVSDGAASGVVDLHAGDKLHFNCHIEYTDERAYEVNAPRLPSEAGSLKFANEVYDGEMCVLFGIVTGDPFLGFPVLDPTPPPAFATVN
jgi:hypothetical protein